MSSFWGRDVLNVYLQAWGHLLLFLNWHINPVDNIETVRKRDRHSHPPTRDAWVLKQLNRTGTRYPSWCLRKWVRLDLKKIWVWDPVLLFDCNLQNSLTCGLSFHLWKESADLDYFWGPFQLCKSHFSWGGSTTQFLRLIKGDQIWTDLPSSRA